MPRDKKPEPPSREELAREYLEGVGFNRDAFTIRDRVLIELDRLWKEKAGTGEHPTSVEIAERVGIASPTVRQHLARLRQEGRVHIPEKGLYVPLDVPDSGE